MKILVMPYFFHVDVDNINLNNDFDEDDSITLIRLLAWHIKFEKRKELKTN